MRTFLISIIFVILLGGMVSAQIPAKPFTAYLQGGITNVSSPESINNIHKLGYNITGGVGFSVAPMFQVVGKLGYHSISKDWDNWPIPDGETITGGKVKILTYGLDMRFSPITLVSPIKPYAYGGIGFAKITEDPIDPSFETLVEISYFQNQTKFYFSAGAGVEFSAGPVLKMFLEAQYLNIKTEGDNLVLIPVSIGVKF